MNIAPKTIHTKVVPRLQTALWTVALFIGTVSFKEIENHILLKLMGVFIVFLVFIWETAIMFLDVKNANPDQNFKGEVLDINARIFFIIPIPFVIGGVYTFFPEWDILFYILLMIMGWIKWECVTFSNNIESHFVDIKPTFHPNKINE